MKLRLLLIFIIVTQGGGMILGNNEVIDLDFRFASLALGDNRAFVFANGLLDLFTSGECIIPIIVDASSAPIAEDTQVLPPPTSPSPTIMSSPTATATFTITPTFTPTTPTRGQRNNPTRTQRPSPTPYTIIDPLTQRDTNPMIMLAVALVFIILFGILLNQRHL